MSSALEATSAVLGEYMLKGWTLTDSVCPHCSVTPLMREPAGEARAQGRGEGERVEFCGRCQGAPGRAVRTATNASSPAEEDARPSRIPARTSSRLMNGRPPSHDITPPDSPPIYQPPAIIPSSIPPASSAPTGPSQSDRASQLISTLLLRGYALLGETCPNSSCRGIPLVGHPRKRGESGPARRECVICGTVYDADGEVVSRPSLAAVAAPPVHAAGPMASETQAESSREAQRRAMYEQGTRINAAVARRGDANVEATPAQQSITNGPAMTNSTDVDMDALPADSAAPSSGPQATSSTVRAIAQSEQILSDLLLALSSSLAAQTRVAGASPTRSEVKEHLDRLGEVYALLDRAAGLRERYTAERGGAGRV